MRHFTILLSPSASSELDRLREEGRAPGLDASIGTALLRLERFPESGAPEKVRGRWSLVRRKVILGRTGYVLRYRLHLATEPIEVLSVRHGRRRPPKL